MEARKLVDFPGGLELHIGVRLKGTTVACLTVSGSLSGQEPAHRHMPP